ncbi:MAG: hypothetical protein ACK53I_03245 [Phenylobacterium sp.]|jgi:hypothetical protein
MDIEAQRVLEGAPLKPEEVSASTLGRLDPTDTLDLHRAINERRARVENAELLKHLRSM